MTSNSDRLDAYTSPTDTWWKDGECPECGRTLYNNGNVLVCGDPDGTCDWWTPVHQHDRDDPTTHQQERKPVVYTAIPKYLVYADPIIGAYVEHHGYAVTTPWQYDYGMGDRVNYDDLIDSLNELAISADEVWAFGAETGLLPETDSINGIGLTNGVIRELNLAKKHGTPTRLFEFTPEEQTIQPVTPAHDPDPSTNTDHDEPPIPGAEHITGDSHAQ